LYLGWPAYLIHGTNQPYGVGRRVSRGCIRLYPEDIERLFKMVPEGTQVTVVAQPVKLGWRGGDLYIEVNPSLAQVDQIEEKGFAEPDPVRELSDPDRILAAAGDDIWRLDWHAISQSLERRQGIPIRITRGASFSRQSGADTATGIDAGVGHSPGSGYRPDRNYPLDRDHRLDPAPTVIGPGIGHY
jgi:L,D-transpeptidase ErfK/SrfK